MGALMALAWPVMLENAMQTLVQYVDTAMVGVLGAQASAAVGLTGSVTWLVNGIFLAVGVGALAVISRALGAKDAKTARETAAQTVFIVAVAGVAMCALTLLAAPVLPGWAQCRQGDLRRCGGPISASSACRCCFALPQWCSARYCARRATPARRCWQTWR